MMGAANCSVKSPCQLLIQLNAVESKWYLWNASSRSLVQRASGHLSAIYFSFYCVAPCPFVNQPLRRPALRRVAIVCTA